MSRETMTFDVVIVGAGVAGLSTAIALAQYAHSHQKSLQICVLEKSAHIGGHVVSGAVLDPRALTELIPDWQAKGAPLYTPVSQDQLLFLTQRRAIGLPVLGVMRNQGHYITSLSHLCQWLAQYAECLGVHIFAGFSAADILFDETGTVCGVVTGDMGCDPNGKPTAQFQAGIALKAPYTVFAEGAHGALSQQLIQRFDLAAHNDPQTYGLGFKEVWDLPQTHCQPGHVLHTVGYPLDHQTYGGGFLYQYQIDNQCKIAVGFIAGLDYQNPYFDPFYAFQCFKAHPAIRTLLSHGERVGFGARALTEGGLQSIPQCAFPGGVLVGCSAGFMNVPKIKGAHTAIKSGICAAKAIFRQYQTTDRPTPVLAQYPRLLKQSWLYDELHKARNVRPAFSRFGLIFGLLYSVLDQILLRGKAPWTLHHKKADHLCTQPTSKAKKIMYPKPDFKITFDKPSSIYLSHLQHREQQPCHLMLRDPTLAIKINYAQYASPETRYCPAGVYEIVFDEKHTPRLHINAANCIHCKTCDIKDMQQNIAWQSPEGGSGPNYEGM